VPLLRQLQQEGIRINVITHSLGARVLLTALNILGDPHPFKTGVFPYAHRAAKQFVVLHSVNDPILGGRARIELIARHLGVSVAEARARVATITRNPIGKALNEWVAAQLRPDEHEATLREAAIGTAGGAYPKKWWRFLDAGLGGPLRGKYDNFMRKQRGARPPTIHWDRLEDALMREMQAHSHLDSVDPEQVPEYQLLTPIATRGLIQEPHVERYLMQLRDLVENGFKTNSKPRPALGHVGFEEVQGTDVFIRDKLEEERFAFVKQDDWLFTHSGMRIPDVPLFENVYRDQIWKRFLSKSGFGHYS